MADRLSQLLAEQILRRELKPNDMLPTEEQLVARYDVSRTVVREAMARLKADGLVVSRQGKGTFVSDSVIGAPFRVSVSNHDPNLVVKEVFELRIAVEAEAAALAAERATPEQVAALKEAFDVHAALIDAGEYAISEDLEFLRLIGQATNNTVYARMIEFLEPYTFHQLTVTRRNRKVVGWLDSIKQEHQQILSAIQAQDKDAARAAAYGHLNNGLNRLKRFAPDV